MMGSYERIAMTLLRGQPKPAPYCVLIDGRLQRGTQSLHRTAQSRMWRTFWRLKRNRMQARHDQV